jgi:UDP-N-acetylmuramoyl-L-alanyl-D-glutamate--2,6-diaminopimelate ligase
MKLRELCSQVETARLPADARDLEVRAVQSDSNEVQPGDIFVAVRGADVDGRAYAAAAAARGAVAVVAESAVDVDVPVVVVSDARRALAELAAISLGRPAERLRLVGITGTLGKTSVLMMLDAILRAADIATAAVGSLGIHFPGHTDATANTTPGALELQRTMADMVSAGTDVLSMEVTSHALTQGRVHGLTFDLGIFTNLTMLEHLEYHGSFRSYAEAKRRFLQYLATAAPLIHPAGDRAVRQLVRQHAGPLVSCGAGNATVSVRRDALGVAGTRITLTVRQPLPRPGASPYRPAAFPLELRTLGRNNVNNAALAAAAGLCLGAEPDHVRTALAGLEPPRRRLQVLRTSDPVIIDDTVGHPDSITGVFEVARSIPHRRLHVAFCIRGQRGPVINARDAEALAIWARSVPIHTLAVSSGTDSADERNEVTPRERDAFLAVLRRAGLPHTHHGRLDGAVRDVIAASGRRDLVLLLGAQGMDAGAEMARRALAAAGRAEAS